MVLQRDVRVPVWGTAEPGSLIKVQFAGQVKTARADKRGQWKVVLAPMKAAREPREMRIVSPAGLSAVVLRDVLVGEVWLCSGQSNMQWMMNATKDAVAEVAAANYPNIRLFTVPMRAEIPAPAEIRAEWRRCAPDTVETFSAVGFFFGREIHRKTGIPVGLINSSWGGTIAEAWTSREHLEAVPFLKRMLKEYSRELVAPASEAGRKLAQWTAKYDQKNLVNAGEADGWHLPESPDGDWAMMDLPRNWQSAGHDYSGVFWFRREMQIPDNWAGRDLTISLGPTDKSDVTYFNGVKVGSMTMEDRPDAWCTPRVYTVPGHLVRAGRAVIAVRVYSNIYHGGFIGIPSQMGLVPRETESEQTIPLAGLWRYRVEANFGVVPPPPTPPRGPGNPNSPHILFDNMIRPLVPYALRGVIWYQGESNANATKDYRTIFPLMIQCWRQVWNQGTGTKSPERAFPFLFVQLANYMLSPHTPSDSAWAELREAQTMALALPNTGMAVAIDIGEALDIHPRNKQDVGLRLALHALAGVHGFKGLVVSGPLYKSMKRERGAIRILFSHVGGGLVVHGDTLTGFAIAGRDKKFVWADARVDGDTVVVSSPGVPRPVAVRYGWADNPKCNLYNASDLPASPFRTDR